MSKKSRPILHSMFLYKFGQDFLDVLYDMEERKTGEGETLSPCDEKNSLLRNQFIVNIGNILFLVLIRADDPQLTLQWME